MKKLNFALIGAGKHGTRWAGVLEKNKDVSLELIIDNDLAKASALALPISGCGANTNIQDFLNVDGYFDAVLIATPHKYLASITERALVFGKHVFCEKPGAITAKQIGKNIMIARRRGLVYKVGYNYRFHDGFIKARELYEKGEIGDLLFIRAKHGFGGREGYEKEWRINKEMGGGGHLHDQGVHLIDMALSFMGEIDKVQGFRADTYWGAGTEDNGFVLLKGGNVIASLHSSLTQWKRMHTFELYGTKGYLIVEGLGMRYGDGEKLIIGKRTKDPDVVKEKVIICDPIADHSLELELKEFISAIKKGEQLDNTDAYETLKIVEDVYRKDKI